MSMARLRADVALARSLPAAAAPMLSSAAARSASGSPGEPSAPSAPGLSSLGVAGVPSLDTTVGPPTSWACGLPVFAIGWPPMSRICAAPAAGTKAPSATSEDASTARLRGCRWVMALISLPRLEGLQERDEVRRLLGVEVDRMTARRTLRGVEVHDVLERLERAVVHVRRRVLDVTQHRRVEAVRVGRALAGRAGVVLAGQRRDAVVVLLEVGEQRAGVAALALTLALEDVLPALGGVGHRPEVD